MRSAASEPAEDAEESPPPPRGREPGDPPVSGWRSTKRAPLWVANHCEPMTMLTWSTARSQTIEQVARRLACAELCLSLHPSDRLLCAMWAKKSTHGVQGLGLKCKMHVSRVATCLALTFLVSLESSSRSGNFWLAPGMGPPWHQSDKQCVETGFDHSGGHFGPTWGGVEKVVACSFSSLGRC